MRRRFVWLVALVPLVAPVAAVAIATLTATPGDLAFATRCVRSAAATKTVTISNDGDPEARNVSVRIAPSTLAAVFPLSGQTVRPTLEADASFNFKVGFVPEVAGLSSARALVTYDAVVPKGGGGGGGGGGPPSESPEPEPEPSESLSPKSTSIPLAGRGIDRWIDASPKTLNFGNLRVGKAAENKTVTIFDDGDTPLSVSSIVLAGEHPNDFTITQTAPATVTDATPLSFTVGFKPRAVGARLAEVVITSDTCDGQTLRVALGGVGVLPDVIAIPHLVDFGTVLPDKVLREFVTVANQGGFPLKVTGIRVVARAPSPSPVPSARGRTTRSPSVVPLPTATSTDTPRIDGKAFFIKDPPPRLPRTLDPGESIDVVVVFKPRRSGPVQAVLEILSNDRDSKVFEVPLSGEGRKLAPTASPTPSASPSVVAPTDPSGSGFDLAFGKYIPEMAVAGAVALFFVLLVVVRRVRGIPE